MGRILKLGALTLACLVLLFPLWLMVINSFTPSQAFLKMPPNLFPSPFTLANYARIFRLPLIARWLGNSAIVIASTVVAGVVVNGAAGYVFRISSSKWVQALFWAFMVPVFMARITILIAQFVIVGKLKLHGLPAVVLMPIFWPAGIYLFRNFFATVPDEIIESARLDGAGDGMVFLRIVLPLSKPIVGAAIVFLGMSALGDYIWQMLNLQRAELQTLLVGLINSTIDVRVVENIGYDLAVGTVLFIPYLILFSLSSRYFIKGLAVGSGK